MLPCRVTPDRARCPICGGEAYLVSGAGGRLELAQHTTRSREQAHPTRPATQYAAESGFWLCAGTGQAYAAPT